VIATELERGLQTGEQTTTVVLDAGSVAVHGFTANDARAEVVRNDLHAQADAEDRDLAGEVGEGCQ
jgi:hypothetical protein